MLGPGAGGVVVVKAMVARAAREIALPPGLDNFMLDKTDSVHQSAGS